MGFKFGKRSHDKLLGVHEDLIKVMDRAIELSGVDFAITEGVRTLDRQQALVKSGVTRFRARRSKQSLASYEKCPSRIAWVAIWRQSRAVAERGAG